MLVAVQRDLFSLGALLATPKREKMQEHPTKARIDATRIAQLEHAIDAGESELPPLTAFILPGGTPKSAALHVARTVCRRASGGSCSSLARWSCHRWSASTSIASPICCSCSHAWPRIARVRVGDVVTSGGIVVASGALDTAGARAEAAAPAHRYVVVTDDHAGHLRPPRRRVLRREPGGECAGDAAW